MHGSSSPSRYGLSIAARLIFPLLMALSVGGVCYAVVALLLNDPEALKVLLLSGALCITLFLRTKTSLARLDSVPLSEKELFFQKRLSESFLQMFCIGFVCWCGTYSWALVELLFAGLPKDIPLTRSIGGPVFMVSFSGTMLCYLIPAFLRREKSAEENVS